MDESDAAHQRNGPAAGARMHGLFTDADTGRLTYALTLSDSCLTVQRINSLSSSEHLDLRDCLGSRAHRGEREDQDAYLCVYFYPNRRRWMASGPVRQRDERRFRLALNTDENDEDANLREAERWARAIRHNTARRPEHTHGLAVIGSVGVDGSGYKEIKTEEGLMAFALVNKVLVWITKKDSTKCWFSDDEQAAKLWFEVDADMVSLKAFAKSRQKGTNLCSNGNGGCSHLCLAFPGGMTCQCAHNHRLVNGKDCSPDSRCPQGTRPCLSEDICLPLEQFCNGVADCPDHSDENCLQDTQHKNVRISPKAFHPGLSNNVIPENVESEACGVTLCNGNGKCSTQNGVTVCICEVGFSGEHCQDVSSGLSQGPVLYGVVGLCAAVVVLGVTVGIIHRKKATSRRQAARAVDVQETGMKELERRREASSAKSNGKDTEFSELNLYQHSSSESSESNESSSSEEVSQLRTTAKPVDLNTLAPDIRGDNLAQTNNTTTHPSLPQTTPIPAFIQQEVVEFELNISFVPLESAVPVTGGPNTERVVAPDVTTPELRCYTVPLPSSEPQPARGDSI
ncbi:very low-density lipo receptor-like protein [Labeo rohita]|uniref:Very low-density lipo receptor-like protein n=1 Tax=Labeo rohita TaxID=84645 RepID=A0A498MHD5_LABRO|nr:very low-density lipo receptor-like protein [Labeo rohita]